MPRPREINRDILNDRDDTEQQTLDDEIFATERSAIERADTFGRGVKRHEDGSISIGPVQFYKTGLVIKREIDEGSWFDILSGLRQIKTTYLWMLADALRYGLDRKYGETREQEERISEITGLSPERLRDLASLAGKYEISSRNENLDITHHKLCQALPDEERDEWLKYADEHNLSVADLEAAIKGVNVVDPSPLDVFKKRWLRFQKAQLSLSKKMTADERKSMALSLRALAKDIENQKD